MFFLEHGTEKLRLWQYARRPAAGGDPEEDLQWVDIIGAIDLQFFTRILRGEQVSALQHFDFAGGEVLFAGVPIYDQNGCVMGGVVLAQPVEQLHADRGPSAVICWSS